MSKPKSKIMSNILNLDNPFDTANTTMSIKSSD